MACMCGDTHCRSCGPAQGNTRCVICKAWRDDGCLHIDEDSGLLKPEFKQIAKNITDVERLGDMIEYHKEELETLQEYKVRVADLENQVRNDAQEIRTLQQDLLKRGVKFP